MIGSLIPFWPWMVIIILATVVWVLVVAIKQNNKVKAQRHEVSQILIQHWLEFSDVDWDKMRDKIDSVSWMKHLGAVRRGEDWKDLYRPEFFGETKDEDHV